ncbi:MAG: alpha/beta hydrolase [candidate division WOR-3 bacterium]
MDIILSLIHRAGEIYVKRAIYSCGYYFKSYTPGDNEIQGVIGSNGVYWPSNQYSCVEYRDNQRHGEYAQRIVSLINAICEATYSDKVNVVAHSMGGYVLRAAIKYYNCDKLNRILMLATPNNGCHYSTYQEILTYLFIIPDWMDAGEAAELGIGEPYPVAFWVGSGGCEGDVEEGMPWYDLLNQGGWPKYEEKYSVIAGDLGRLVIAGIPVGPADGVVDVWWVHWGPARFNVTHRSSHSSDPEGPFSYKRVGELSLIASEFSTEYIKTWIIDGKEDRTGEPEIREDQVILPQVWHVYQEDLKLRVTGGTIDEFLSIQIVLEKYGTAWAYSGIDAYWGVSYRDGKEVSPGSYEFVVAKRGSFQTNTPFTYNVHVVFYSLNNRKEIIKSMTVAP